MKAVVAILTVVLVGACGGTSEETGGQAETSIPEGSCLQLEVAVGAGFSVDGRPTSKEDVGPALSAALDSGDRTAIVDVSCREGVTMESIRELHDIMLEQGLHRIQYFREPDPPIPYALPTSEMDAHLAELPAEERCVVAIATSGTAVIDGVEFSGDLVASRLESNPGVVFVIAATDDVKYVDFARVLGEVTGAGARRVAIKLASG
jgi:biopolymer transport protein ExbD